MQERYYEKNNSGLSQREAEKNLRAYGPNSIQKKKKVSPFKIFASQFNDFITWVLIGATIISYFMGEKVDAITILIIILMNAILGFIQEFKTEKSLEALNKLAAPTAKVVRDNKLYVIKAEDVVPGDLAILEAGDRIPADGKIIETNNLVVDESLLTGESVGVEKDTRINNNVFMGTIITKGKCKAVIQDTGMNTEMGKIANMLDNIESDKSPLKEKLNGLGKVIVVICIVICAAVTILGIYRGQDKYQMFLTGVSLAVAAIPEGLAAIVTVALALGVSRMLKRKALVRKLPAVETLGCTSVICSDKTGTLTQNKMTVVNIFANNQLYKNEKLDSLKNSILREVFTACNDCEYDFSSNKVDKAILGDPTEMALVKVFYEDIEELKNKTVSMRRIYDLPFDSIRKMMSVVVEKNGQKISYVKGAPERILERCRYILIDGEKKLFTQTDRTRIERAIEEMSKQALRCIAGAYKDTNVKNDTSCENDLIFVGVAGMIDPPRPEVKDAIEKCMTAGIRVVMITGDHKNTAYAVGNELNICSKECQVVTGEELDKLSDKELVEVLKEARIFARVSPKHKLRVVQAFKKMGQVVAMTGDGVNDAPAVKEADIGVSMGISGTDVTKEASAMILLDDNFSTIVAAVEEGRVIYDNIRKFIRYLLSCNIGEVLTMFLASLFYLPTPMLPIQILFVNLATDGLPAIALGVDPSEKDVMGRKPRGKDESIFARGLKELIILRGGLIGICTLLSFMTAMHFRADLQSCRTIALSTLILSQLIHVFECRSEHHSIVEINLFSNIALVGAVLVSISMLLSIIYIPFLQGIFKTVALAGSQWLIVVFYSSVIAVLNCLYMFLAKGKHSR